MKYLELHICLYSAGAQFSYTEYTYTETRSKLNIGHVGTTHKSNIKQLKEENNFGLD